MRCPLKMPLDKKEKNHRIIEFKFIVDKVYLEHLPKGEKYNYLVKQRERVDYHFFVFNFNI